MSDGLFDLTAEAVRVLSAPDITHAMIAAITSVADQVVSDEISPEDAVAKFSKIFPPFGEVAKRALGLGGGALVFLTFAVGVWSLINQKEQTELAREQTALAREQTQIMRDQKDDKTLEKILETLSAVRFSSRNPDEQKAGNHAQAPSTSPSAAKAAAKASPAELKRERKPKARELRRKARKQHRAAWGGARHSAPDCG